MAVRSVEEIVRRTVEEVVRGRNFDAVYDIFSEDYVDNSPSPGQQGGRAGLRQVLEEYLTAFPDLQVNIQDIVIGADKAATREVWIGTHLGNFRGIPATGRTIHRNVLHIFRISRGKIAEEWSEGTDIAAQLKD